MPTLRRYELASAFQFCLALLLLGWAAGHTSRPPLMGVPLWPPVGLAFGFFYARGFRLIPVYILLNAVLMYNESLRYERIHPLGVVLGATACLSVLYAVQMYASVRLTRYWLGPDEKLVQIKRIAAFLLISGPVHVLPVSALGTLLVCSSGSVRWSDSLVTWANWYGSDLLGAVLFGVPALILWSKPHSLLKARLGTVALPTATALILTCICYFATRHEETRLMDDQFRNEIRTVHSEAAAELKYAELYARRYTYLKATSILQAREKMTKANLRLREMPLNIPWVLGAACATIVPHADRIEYEARSDPRNPATARFPIGSAGDPQSRHDPIVVTLADARSPLKTGMDLHNHPTWAELIAEATQTCDAASRTREHAGGTPTVVLVVPCLPEPSWNVPNVPHGFFLVELDIDAMLTKTMRKLLLPGSLQISKPDDVPPVDGREYHFILSIGRNDIQIVGRRTPANDLLHAPKYSMLIGIGGAILTLLLMVLLLTSTGQTILTNEEVVRRTKALELEMRMRKTVEASLRMSESSLMDSQRLAGLGYWEWKRAVDGLYWSPILSEMLGFQGSDIRMQLEDLTARIHPDDRQRITAQIETMSGRSRPVDAEFRIQRVDGSFRWFEAVISTSEGGADDGVRGTMLDVTDRKRVETALRDSEARLRIALHSAMMGTWEWVLGSNQLIWDTRQQAIFGISDGSFDHKLSTFLDRIFPADRLRIEQTLLSIQKSGKPFTDEFRIVRADGEVRWVAGFGHPLSERPGSQPRYVGIFLDITDRKRNEIDLRESEARRRQALDAGGMGTLIWELLPDRMSWDAKLHSLFGVVRGEFDGTPAAFLDRIDRSDRREIDEKLEDFIFVGSEANFSCEFRIKHYRDIRWLTGRFHLVHDAVGKPVRMVGILFDSTERRQIEDSVRAGREMLKRAQALAGIGSFDWNPTTDTTIWSDEMYRILGYEPQAVEPSYDNFIRNVHPDDRELIEVRFAAAIGRNEPYDYEFRVVQPNGNLRYITVQAELTRNDRGEIVAFRGVNQDITERKLFEQQLQRSEARLNDAQRIARAGSWQWHVETDAMIPSAALLEICGFAEGQGLTFRDYFAWIHDDDVPTMKAVFEGITTNVDQMDSEFRFHFGGTQERWYAIRGRVEQRTEGLTLILGTLQDITELKREEEERRKFTESLQQTQKLESLGILAGGVAHDFNNLLTGILGNAGLAREFLPRDSELHEFLRPIEKSAEHAAELCQQMLVYAGKGTITRGPVDLNQLINESLDLLKLAASRKAKLTFDLAEKLPVLEGDAGRLRQILLNLVQNASEALPTQGGTISIRTGRQDEVYQPEPGSVLSGQPPQSETIWLEIRDDGGGMPPETLARIFEPFFTTKFTGRGLGLSAVHGIVRDHGGCLAVSSATGRGTSFRILLPSERAMHATPQPMHDTPLPTGWSQTKRHKALVIDNEPTLRGIATFTLRSLGFRLEETGDGLHAVELFRTRPDDYSLILLDLMMPNMDGCATLHALRNLRPDIHVILIGSNLDSCPITCEDDSRISFLEKPFRAVDLTSAVRRVMKTTYAGV